MTATDPVTGADPDQAAPAVIGDPWTMPDPFAAIVSHLIDGDREAGPAIALDLTRWLGNHPEPASGTGLASLAAAFLVSLAGPDHPLLERAEAILATPPGDAPPELVELFRTASAAVPREVAERRTGDRHFSQALADAGSLLDGHPLGRRVARDAIWSVLYPEAAGLFGDIDGAIAALRRRRIVERIEPNPHPITDAAREVLFTSNVLLGLPLDGPGIPAPGLDPEIAAGVARARAGSQQHWFDHPIPIGVDTAANELLHGLRGLDAAMAAEPGAAAQPGFAAGSPGALPLRRLTCLLSVSVTHDELHEIARRCVELDLATIDPLPHLDILVASETDVRRLVEEVLLPAISTFASAGSEPGPAPRLAVLGVDGEYGRHYSFLKAIAAIWQVFVDPAVRGTFKIDLDQVFPQSELVVQTGRTALQHLETPLWGGHGRDSDGRRVELGMVAGALVNAGDIERGLFTADITVPAEPARASEWVFFSPLPQAISTQAEMLERYDTAMPDGVETALERIHVTGGTNGILVEALRRYRPFTPSFIGRAEDQAYILSTLGDRAEVGLRPRGRPGHAPRQGCLRWRRDRGGQGGQDGRRRRPDPGLLVVRTDRRPFARGERSQRRVDQIVARSIHGRIHLTPAGHHGHASLRPADPRGVCRRRRRARTRLCDDRVAPAARGPCPGDRSGRPAGQAGRRAGPVASPVRRA